MAALQIYTNIAHRKTSTLVYCSKNEHNRKSVQQKRDFLKNKFNYYKKRDIEMLNTRRSEISTLFKDVCANDFIALQDIINSKLNKTDTTEDDDEFDLPVNSYKITKDDYIRDE